MSHIIIIHDDPDADHDLVAIIEDAEGKTIGEAGIIVPGGEIALPLELGTSIRVAHRE